MIEVEQDADSASQLTLGHHIDDYFLRRTDVKPATRVNWGHTRRNLVMFFGAEKPLADVTVGNAKNFERYLQTESRENAYAGTKETEGLKPDTVRKRISNAKLFFRDAVEHELIDRNAFTKLKSAMRGNRNRDFFVTLEMARKVLDACPNVHWRLLFALARFGGARSSSESLA